MEKIFIGFLVLVLTSASWGGEGGSISAATGGAGRASIEPSDSAFLNPATMSFLRGYFFTSSYATGAQEYSDLRLSVTDSMKDTIVPTAAGYSQATIKTGDNLKVFSRDFRLAFGEKVNDRLAFGIAGNYKNDRTDLDSYSQTNFTLGSALGITQNFSVGLVFNNLLTPAKTIPQELRLKPTVGLGASYNYKRVIRTRLDLISAENFTLTRPTIAGGVESFMNKWLVLRVGAAHDSDNDFDLYSAGVGFHGPRFGLHYAYVNSTENENPVRHSVDLAIPIW